MKSNLKNWEERFDKEFHYLYEIQVVGNSVAAKGVNQECIKSFIRSLLSQTRKEGIEEGFDESIKVVNDYFQKQIDKKLKDILSDLKKKGKE